MTALAPRLGNIAGIALPAALLAAALGAIAWQVLPALPGTAPAFAPQTVTLPPGELHYRAGGHFFVNGVAVDAPMETTRFDEPLTIMKYQVTAAEYAACVADGACTAADPRNVGEGDVPVTGVNFRDATDYAAWLSARTGQAWTLPTDQQWAYAAGELFVDDALGIEDNAANPAERWLADYRREAARQAEADPVPRAIGSFGQNENGLFDMHGNVWEWTQTCHRRVHLDGAGELVSELPACNIRVLEGKHRASVTYFIRDARSGGCSVGVPPDNLGFRLVRQPQWHENLLNAIGL